MQQQGEGLSVTECNAAQLEFHGLGRRAVMAADKADPTGQNRLCERDKGKALANSSTLDRLELTPANANAEARYKKIVANPTGMDRLLVDCFLDAHDTPPQTIWIDLDATDDPSHGERQEEWFFHGYYDGYGYLPLYIFSGPHLLCARLRPSNIDACEGSVQEVERIVGSIRARWPEAKIVVRADSGFCCEDLMAWVARRRAWTTCSGCPKNSRLLAASLGARVQAQIDYLHSGEPARVFCQFDDRTCETWSREQRVVCKAEHLAKGPNPRYVVTSLSPKEADPRTLYEDLYCARGDMENRYPRSSNSTCSPTAPAPPPCAPTRSGCTSPPSPT